MKFSQLEIPSNRKFGFFFTFVFLFAFGYFLKNESTNLAYFFAILFIVFLIVTLVKADFLLPLNLAWMRFGLLLGIIVSPIILGIIFFGLITPYSIVMRLFGRDELILKKYNLKSYWKSRDQICSQNDFTKQF